MKLLTVVSLLAVILASTAVLLRHGGSLLAQFTSWSSPNAAVPSQVPFQAVLTQPVGAPVADGSYTIVDHKTSRYTRGQRGLFSLYEAQLNAYAFTGERLGLYPVRRLALVYMEPVTDEGTAADPHLVDDQGFSLGFKAKVVDVDLKPDSLIPPLLRKAKEISLLESPPLGLPECKDCDAVDGLISALRGPN